MLNNIFKEEIKIDKNFVELKSNLEAIDQQYTNEDFSEKWTEYKKMITDNNLEIKYFHEEEACFSGRFLK